MRNETARELRILRRELVRVNRRIATSKLPGKVKPGSQDMEKRTVRLILGETGDGVEILSPPVRWAQQGAGRLKLHSVPNDNEQMFLESASGTIGEGSIANWATYDKDHESPSKEKNEAVIEFEEGTKVTIKKDSNRVQSKKVHVDAQVVTLGGEGGPPVARKGDRVYIEYGSSKGFHRIYEGSDIVSAT